jgi:hypothetical protein
MGTWKTSHPGVRPPSEIRADGHGERRLTRALGHHRKQQRLNQRVRRALWLGTRKPTYLQQAHRKLRQQPQQTDQPSNTRPLSLFYATPTFEALMIVLHQPPMSIPLDPLPGLFERRGGHRREQDPFQWFFSVGSLLFPDAHDPNCQGFLARSRLMAGWQERHLTKGQLQLGRTCWVPMSGWHLERTARLARKGSCEIQSILDLFLALLHTPILGRSYQKVGLCGLTGFCRRGTYPPPDLPHAPRRFPQQASQWSGPGVSRHRFRALLA